MRTHSLRNGIRTVNKHVLNPLMLKVAGKTRSPISVIHHVGRRSGKRYKTPVITVRSGDGFVFVLTYGPEVDWYHNVGAAGGGTLSWNGTDFALGTPEPLATETGLAVFPAVARVILRILGLRHFMTMRYRAGQGPA